MSGKEIKKFVSNQNDTEYTVMILNNDGKRVSYNAIKDDEMYNFKKIDEIHNEICKNINLVIQASVESSIAKFCFLIFHYFYIDSHK